MVPPRDADVPFFFRSRLFSGLPSVCQHCGVDMEHEFRFTTLHTPILVPILDRTRASIGALLHPLLDIILRTRVSVLIY